MASSTQQIDVPVIDTETGEEAEISIFVGDESNPLDVAREAIETDAVVDWSTGEIKLDTSRFDEYGLTEYTNTAKHEQSVSEQSDGADCSSQTAADILQECSGTYEEKTEDYGNAWRIAGDTIALWAQENNIGHINPKDPDHMASLNLYIQRIHKLVRAFNLEFGDQQPHNEPLLDSHKDGATYAGIHAEHEEQSNND